MNPLENKDVATEGFPCCLGGARSGCLILQHKTSAGICSLLGTHGWCQSAWQLNSLVESIMLLREPRQLLSAGTEQASHPAPAIACLCVPASAGHRRGGVKGSVASGAEGIPLYPGPCGFAAQHHPHNHPPGHGVPWCLARPRDTLHHCGAPSLLWGAQRLIPRPRPAPESRHQPWLSMVSSTPRSSASVSQGRVSSASLAAEGRLAGSLPLDSFSFLHSLFPPTFRNETITCKKRATQKEGARPREHRVRQNKPRRCFQEALAEIGAHVFLSSLCFCCVSVRRWTFSRRLSGSDSVLSGQGLCPK